MQYSTNFNMNKPELNEQYRLSHWNENTDIIDTEMQAIRSGTDEVMKETLLNFCYPIGSIYWSGVATNPHDLFGGTWEQIKDKFVWAKGDSDVLDATGGEKTHTLTTTEMPTHTHTFTGSAVTSDVNSRGHTHSVTASGTISGGAYKFTGSAVTSGGMSAHSSGWFVSRVMSNNIVLVGTPNGNSGSTTSGGVDGTTFKGEYQSTGYSDSGGAPSPTSANQNKRSKISIDVSHTHSVTAAGTISITTNPTFSGSSVTSGAESQNHTHSVTASGTNSDAGSGEAHNNMPPYVVKYCWQRTA